MKNSLKLFLTIFLCSFASLAYEITLMRIFSISLSYHFAFMIISMAMLGIGASGTVLTVYPRLINLAHLGPYCLMLGAGISLSYLASNQIPFDPVQLSWSRTEILFLGVYYILLSLPFFCTGLVITTALSCLADKAGFIYGADLLGAGSGALGALCLMTLTGPENAVLTVSLAALTAALFTGNTKVISVSLILSFTTALVICLQPSCLKLRISPYKELPIAMTHPGAEHLKTYYSPYSRIDTVKSPAVRFAPGISLRYPGLLPEQIGISIDGGALSAVTKAGDKASLAFLSYLPSAIPYAIVHGALLPCHSGQQRSPENDLSAKNEVLIIEPKGGLQVLVAEYYGFETIIKTENNPLLIEVMNNDFHAFSGGIYSRNTWPGLGRSWLLVNHKTFDIIDIPITGMLPSGSFGIAEDFRFTEEAFREYLMHLKADGFVSIIMFILPPARMELRILATAVNSLENLGLKEAGNHIAAIRSIESICILIKRSPLRLQEIGLLKRFSQEKGFDLVYYPGIRKEETNLYIRMKTDDYADAFSNIIHTETRKRFIDSSVFDIKPVRDDKPYFHYYLKAKNIREIYATMSGKWQYFIEEGYILPMVFIQTLVMSILLIILPLFSEKQKSNPSMKGGGSVNKRLLPYFAFLGIGFMFVEVSIIQKVLLPLENPSYAAATVIIAILTSSGAGSLMSYRFALLRKPLIVLITSLCVVAYTFSLPFFSGIISVYPITLKIILVILFLIPVGFLMGIPFPTALRFLSEKNPVLIPWAWAINACFSVLAPVLTIMLAISIGFQMVLIMGALAYMMAFLNLWLAVKRGKPC